MEYINNWQKDLNRKNSLTLIILFIFLFACYEYILFSRLSSRRHLDKAFIHLEKARFVNKEIIVEKLLLYQKALKFLRNAMRLNSYDARPYFEFAQVISEIRSDSELANSLDIKSLSGWQEQEQDDKGFYNLAKANYIEAILREPTNPIYHQRLGSIYDKLSYAENAEKEFNKAVLLDPQNLMLHLYLSRYFYIKDRQTEFLKHLNKTLDLYKVLPRSPFHEKVEEFLRKIDYH